MQKELYNKAYQKFTPEFLSDEKRVGEYLSANRDSLVKFLTSHQEQFGYSTQDSNVLELGCGIGSLSFWLAQRFKSVTAIDISDLAISLAQSINTQNNIVFKQSDAKIFQTDERFDFILDSHLFHCLSKKSWREEYLQNIKQLLKPGGWFLMEAMVMQDRLQVPVGFELNGQGELLQEINGTYHPFRCILPSLQIEKEVQEAGLKLNYFYYHHELSFQVFDGYHDYPAQFLPKTIRLSSKLD